MPDTMTDTPDYTTMTGAAFQRAVGHDPDKWAEAMYQNMNLPANSAGNLAAAEERVAFLREWLANAMAAAVKASTAE